MNYATQYPRLWRTFFSFFAVGAAWTLIDAIFFTEESFGKSAIGVISSFALLVPLHGYVWQRAYKPRWLWRVLLWWSILLFSVAVLAAGFALANVGEKGVLVLLVCVAAIVVEFFYFFAVNQYLSHSPHLWQQDLTSHSSGAPSASADF